MACTGSQAVTGQNRAKQGYFCTSQGQGAEKYTNRENFYNFGGGIVNRAYRRYIEDFNELKR